MPRNQVTKWEEQFLRFMREQKGEVRNALVQGKKMTPEIEKQLREAIDVFAKQFKA